MHVPLKKFFKTEAATNINTIHVHLQLCVCLVAHGYNKATVIM